MAAFTNYQIFPTFNQDAARELNHLGAAYFEDCKMRVSVSDTAIYLTELADAMKPGRSCRRATLRIERAEQGKYAALYNVLELTYKYNLPALFEALVAAKPANREGNTEFAGYAANVYVHEEKAARQWAPWVKVNPLKEEPAKWTVPHVVRALLNGQYSSCNSTGQYTDDYHGDACNNFGIGKADALRLAQKLIDSPSGWWINKRGEAIGVHLYQFSNYEFTLCLTPPKQAASEPATAAEVAGRLYREEVAKVSAAVEQVPAAEPTSYADDPEGYDAGPYGLGHDDEDDENDELDGTSGQDRKSYSDDQDREHYTVADELSEEPAAPALVAEPEPAATEPTAEAQPAARFTFATITQRYREEADAAPGVEIPGLFDRISRAYSGISMSPEKRARDYAKEYKQQLAEQLAAIHAAGAQAGASPERIQEAADRYQAGYVDKLNAMLSAKSRCISWMITGRSNFPTRRAEKANNSEHARTGEFIQYTEAGHRKALASLKTPPTTEERAAAYRKKAADLTELQELMKRVNKVLRAAKGKECSAELVAAGFPASQCAAIQQPDFAGRVGFSYQLQNNLAEIKRVQQLAEECEQKAAAQAAVLAGEQQQHPARPFELNGQAGEVLVNVEADRVQLYFDAKPDAATISQLKSRGFKWAPSAGAWQRQDTANARFTVLQLLSVNLNEAPAGRVAEAAPAAVEPEQLATTSAEVQHVPPGTLAQSNGDHRQRQRQRREAQREHERRGEVLKFGPPIYVQWPASRKIAAYAAEGMEPTAEQLAEWKAIDNRRQEREQQGAGNQMPAGTSADQGRPDEPADAVELAAKFHAAEAEVDFNRLVLLAGYHGPAQAQHVERLPEWHPLAGFYQDGEPVAAKPRHLDAERRYREEEANAPLMPRRRAAQPSKPEPSPPPAKPEQAASPSDKERGQLLLVQPAAPGWHVLSRPEVLAIPMQPAGEQLLRLREQLLTMPTTGRRPGLVELVQLSQQLHGSPYQVEGRPDGLAITYQGAEVLRLAPVGTWPLPTSNKPAGQPNRAPLGFAYAPPRVPQVRPAQRAQVRLLPAGGLQIYLPEGAP